jgi:DNA modification methylase
MLHARTAQRRIAHRDTPVRDKHRSGLWLTSVALSCHDDFTYREEKATLTKKIGPFDIDTVVAGDCLTLIPLLPDESIDVLITSPPYWGQRVSHGNGVEEDPRDYLQFLTDPFASLLPKLKESGIIWINLGDAYNTPVNWRLDDRKYSSLGPDKNGLAAHNSAYVKPRAQRKAFIDKNAGWLQYGNLLALPCRLVVSLCDKGYLYRGEIIWRKKNAMPEGQCRRPHRQHEAIYLLAKNERHSFRTSPPVPSVWEFGNEKIDGQPHYSRFPEELPLRCIEAYGKTGAEVVVIDPFSGSGTTGIAALKLHCSYIGFEIDPVQADASNERLTALQFNDVPLCVAHSRQERADHAAPAAGHETPPGAREVPQKGA